MTEERAQTLLVMINVAVSQLNLAANELQHHDSLEIRRAAWLLADYLTSYIKPMRDSLQRSIPEYYRSFEE